MASRAYERLHVEITHALAQRHYLDEDAVRRVKAIADGETLQQTAVEASTKPTAETGEFAAIAAAYTVDQSHDRIRYGAFTKTIRRWQTSRKRIPLHWNHSAEAKDIIGSVDASSMQEIAGIGLFVCGKLDLQASEVARQAWRLMTADTVGLSFGYLTVKSEQRGDVRDLLELDLFEISLTPSPMNPDTRILETKAAMALARDRDLRNLRRRCDELALEAALGWKPAPAAKADPEPQVPTEADLRRGARALGIPLRPIRPPRSDDVDVRARSYRWMMDVLSMPSSRIMNRGEGPETNLNSVEDRRVARRTQKRCPQ